MHDSATQGQPGDLKFDGVPAALDTAFSPLTLRTFPVRALAIKQPGRRTGRAPTETMSYVVIARWTVHGAGYVVELDCSGRLVGDRRAVDSKGSGTATGRWNTEHA